MDSAETTLEFRLMHKGHEIVTSAQARDLSYGSREVRPNDGRELHPNGDLRRTASVLQREMALRDVAEPHDQVLLAVGAHSELVMIPGPESVKAARDFTAATLRSWNLDLLIDEAVIVASELVTNAIRHGSCLTAPDPDAARVELAWRRDAERVVCVVTDCSSMPPVLEDADVNSESGRGLQVVHALAAAWGWVMLGAREKAVWAAFLLP